MQNYQIYTSTGRYDSGSSFTLQGSGTLTQPTTTTTVTDVFNFNSPVTGHYIRINVLSDYGNVAYATLADVRFQATPIASGIITPVAATASTYATSYYTSECSPSG